MMQEYLKTPRNEIERAQRRALCNGFLTLNCQGEELDAIQARNKMQKHWGVSVDHHDMSEALEMQRMFNKARYSDQRGFDGHRRYVILEEAPND